MSRLALSLVVTLAVGAVAAFAASHAAPKVPYPEGYRGWTHLKSMAITSKEHPLFESFGGIHHVYVNGAGLAAAHGKGEFPDGAVLVFDLLAAESKDGAITEGERKFIGVMRRDAKAYAATGGWGFEGFAGDSKDERMVTDAAKQCFACHMGRKDAGYVFSSFRR